MTKSILLLIALVCGPVTAGSATRQVAAPTEVRIPGAVLRWVHLAEPEFAKQKLDLDKYVVLVVLADPDQVTVSVTEPETLGIGRVGGTAYVVKISKATMKVTSAQWTAWR